MSAGVVTERPIAPTPRVRLWILGAAAVLLLLTFLPPLSHLARRYEFGQILRYGLWAMVVPFLVTLGAPWSNAASAIPLARGRARHPEFVRAVGFVLLGGIIMVAWFTPVAVRATARRPWLAVAEALTLMAGGTGLWLEMVESPPLVPRSRGLVRVALGAGVMWLVWIEAYLLGLSHSSWYRSFGHVGGHGLSQAADQQLAAVVLWFIAALVFVPVIFWNAMRWLQSEQDPDHELRRLMREVRRDPGDLMHRRRCEVPREGDG